LAASQSFAGKFVWPWPFESF